MNNFPEKLKLLREERGMSKNKLALSTGFSSKAICNWESGAQVPSINVLIKFADFFEVSADYLLGRKEY